MDISLLVSYILPIFVSVFSFILGAPAVEERISICIYRREIYKNMGETAQLSSENKRKRGM